MNRFSLFPPLNIKCLETGCIHANCCNLKTADEVTELLKSMTKVVSLLVFGQISGQTAVTDQTCQLVNLSVSLLLLLRSMNYPPTKRLRGLNQDIATAGTFDDPFGDDEDFTQADLDEIDIIASQAITTAPASGLGSKTAVPSSVGQSKPQSRATTNQSRENTFGFTSKRGNAGISSREPLSEFRASFFFMWIGILCRI